MLILRMATYEDFKNEVADDDEIRAQIITTQRPADNKIVRVTALHLTYPFRDTTIVWFVHMRKTEFYHSLFNDFDNLEPAFEDLIDLIANDLQDRDIKVRPGIYDLGDAKPFPGDFRKVIVWNEQEQRFERS